MVISLILVNNKKRTFHPVIARVIEYLSQHDLNSVPVGEKVFIQDDSIFLYRG